MDDDNWINMYLNPNTPMWKLTNSLPGNVTIWAIKDVWQVGGRRVARARACGALA